MGMRIEPKIEVVSIVLTGNFNPAIFTPAWFALQELLPEWEATSARLEIAHEQIVQFNTDWLRLEVTRDRFLAATTQAPHMRVRDLVIRVFHEYLHHTPMKEFGINYDVHFLVSSMEARHAFGGKLVPVEPWGEMGRELGLNKMFGGLRSLRMAQGKPEGRPGGGRILITVEPSNLIGNGRLGVYVGCNDNYVIGGSEPGTAGDGMMLLERTFGTSLDRSKRIVDHVMSLVPTKEI